MAKGSVIDLRAGRARGQAVEDAEKLFQEMLAGYQQARTGRRAAAKSLADETRIIRDLRTSSGRYPWEWAFEDWDAWNAKLVTERGISAATQRKYQGIIRSFFDYLTKRESFCQAVKARYGREIRQFLDEGELLRHLYDTELNQPRARFTEEQSHAFFRAVKGCIKRAEARPVVNGRPNRVLLNHQRDFALFFTIHACGMRAGSAVAMTTWGFESNPKIPELGRYGKVITVGKGSKGAGPKPLSIPVDDLRFAAVMDWYLTEVRPYFLSTANPNEDALFLAEGGQRMSYQSIWSRFQIYLKEADLCGMGLCLHSYRHQKATSSAVDGYDLETARRMLGHAYGSTTQGYMGVPDQFCQAQIDNNLRRQIELAKSAKDDH